MRTTDLVYESTSDDAVRKWLLDSGALPMPLTVEHFLPRLAATGLVAISGTVRAESDLGPVTCVRNHFIITRVVPLPWDVHTYENLGLVLVYLPNLLRSKDRDKFPPSSLHVFTPADMMHSMQQNNILTTAANDVAALAGVHPSTVFDRKVPYAKKVRLTLPQEKVRNEQPIEQFGRAASRVMESVTWQMLLFPLLAILVALALLGSPLAAIVFLTIRTIVSNKQGYLITKDFFLEAAVGISKKGTVNTAITSREVREVRALTEDLDAEFGALVSQQLAYAEKYWSNPMQFARYFSPTLTEQANTLTMDASDKAQGILHRSVPPKHRSRKDRWERVTHAEVADALHCVRKASSAWKELEDLPVEKTIPAETLNLIHASRKELTGDTMQTVPVMEHKHLQDSKAFLALPHLTGPAIS